MTTSSGAPVADNQNSDNIKIAMDGVSIEIMRRQPAHFDRADRDYETGVAARMGISVSDKKAADAAE